MAENAPAAKSGSGLEPNIAGLLAWIFAPISSIIFLITDPDDKFIKFHALQSLIWSIVAMIISTILSFTIILACLFWLPFVVSIYGAYKAYNKEMWKLPIIGDWVEKQL